MNASKSGSVVAVAISMFVLEVGAQALPTPKNGLYNVPILDITTEDTVVGVFFEVKGEQKVSTTIERTATITRTLKTNQSRQTETVREVKNDIGGKLGLDGTKFVLNVDASASTSNRQTETYKSVLETSSEDAQKLEEISKLQRDNSVAYTQNAGFFRSAVLLNNLTSSAGYVENLRVALVAEEGGSRTTLDSTWVCDEAGVVKDASSADKPAAKPSSCRLRVYPNDPVRPARPIPVQFRGVNTDSVFKLLQSNATVKIEVAPLEVVVGDVVLPEATLRDELRTSSIRVTTIDREGRVSVRNVHAAAPMAISSALQAVHAKAVDFSEDKTRVMRVGSLKSIVEKWGDPKTYSYQELGQGAWVVSAPTETPITSLSDEVPPGAELLLMYVTKRDQLSALDKRETFQAFSSSFPVDAANHVTDAFCYPGTKPGRRIVPGDRIELEAKVEKPRLALHDRDFTQLPWATRPQDGFNFNFRNIYELFGLSDRVLTFTPDPFPVFDLADFPIFVQFERDLAPIHLKDVIGKTRAWVTPSIDGTMSIRFEVPKEFLPRGKGEICVMHVREDRPVTYGRQAKRLNPPPPPSGPTASVPGPGFGQLMKVVTTWIEQYPYREHKVGIGSRVSAALTVVQSGRAKDDPLVKARDSDETFFMSQPCKVVRRSFDPTAADIKKARECPVGSNLHTCLQSALQGKVQPIPAGVNAAVYKNGVLSNACQGRRGEAILMNICGFAETVPTVDCTP